MAKNNAYNDGTYFKKGNPGKPKGCKHKVTLLREDVVRAILEEKVERDKEAQAQGKRCWMATLDNDQFLQLVKPLIPKNIDLTGGGIREVLDALIAKSQEADG